MAQFSLLLFPATSPATMRCIVYFMLRKLDPWRSIRFPATSGATANFTGQGRTVVGFKYSGGFPSHTRVEVTHTGKSLLSERVGVHV